MAGRSGSQRGESPIARSELARLRAAYPDHAVDALLMHFGPDFVQAANMLLARWIYGPSRPYEDAFLRADLSRRKSEAEMVAAEAAIFRDIARMVASTADALAAGPPKSAQAANALAAPISAAAELVSALADKNSTMGEGYPGGGGTPPGEEPLPPPPSAPPVSEPPCYERYKRELADLWDQKDSLPAYDFWLQWARLLSELTLCAGPEAARLIIDLIKAGKGGD